MFDYRIKQLQCNDNNKFPFPDSHYIGLDHKIPLHKKKVAMITFYNELNLT